MRKFWHYISLVILLVADMGAQTHVFASFDHANIFTNTNQFQVGAVLGPTAFGGLPAAANGTIIYVTDGSPTNPCTGLGGGAFALRIAGAWNCTLGAAGTVTGTGTLNQIPKWSSASALTNSSLLDNGTTVSTNEAVSTGALSATSLTSAVGNITTVNATNVIASAGLQGATATVTGLTPGNCVQAGTGGLLTTTSSACGSGGGGGGVTGSGTTNSFAIWTSSSSIGSGNNNIVYTSSTGAITAASSSTGGSNQAGQVALIGANGTGTGIPGTCGGNILLTAGRSVANLAGGSISVAGACDGQGGTLTVPGIQLNPLVTSSSQGGVVALGQQTSGGSAKAAVLTIDEATFAELSGLNLGNYTGQSHAMVWCVDCSRATIGATCTGSSSGALAIWKAATSVWSCY